MAEPTSSSIAAVTIATGITLTGSLFGLQADELLAGLFGGLLSLMHLTHEQRQPPIEPPWLGHLATLWWVASILGSAAIMGALAAPAAHAATVEYFSFAKNMHGDGLRLGLAGLVGLSAQIVIPLLFARLKRKGAE